MTHYDKDLYVMANSPADAEAQVRNMAMNEPNFWIGPEWGVSESSDDEYFVEEA
jgi:hypothetical protein